MIGTEVGKIKKKIVSGVVVVAILSTLIAIISPTSKIEKTSIVQVINAG
ncbi:hypothetical protein ACTQ6A_03690 [Lachnospiraceae bacterium LCP25S3_G4]